MPEIYVALTKTKSSVDADIDSNSDDCEFDCRLEVGTSPEDVKARLTVEGCVVICVAIFDAEWLQIAYNGRALLSSFEAGA